jgi:hypothetical protein
LKHRVTALSLLLLGVASPSLADPACKQAPPPTPEPTLTIHVTRDELAIIIGGLADRMDGV